jgi:glycosyltransferase involved in cell wall biosynthesis
LADKSNIYPKISIVTVCFNSAKTIRETIESVINQDYPSIEYIVVDGNSTDGTQEVVQSYLSDISVFVSERDNGLYHAMNKAIDMCTGEVVGILNSDDLYDNSGVLSAVMAEFLRTPSIECVFGDLNYFETGKPDKPVRFYKGKGFTRNKVRWGITPPHPTFFVRKAVYEKYEKFDLQFKYAADFDLMIRFLYVYSISFRYLELPMVKMRLGGVSTGSFKRIIEINKEDLKAYKKYGIKTNFFLFHLKYFFKILQVKNILRLIKSSLNMK